MTPLLRMAAVFFCGLVASVAWADQPSDWLKRMDVAIEQASYRGVVIREQPRKTDTFKVVHAMRDGVVRSRLVRQEGDGIEILRNGNEVHCVLPDKRAVLVETWDGQGRLFAAMPDDLDALSAAYDFELGDETRIAGRKAVVVSITPKDSLRFARRVWLDVDTGFPLKAERSDGQGRLVERIRFADIELGAELVEQDFESAYAIDDFQWIPTPKPVLGLAATGWHSNGLPTGFRKESGHVEQLDANATDVTHIVYTDGLSRVSVFIKSGDDNVATTRGRLGNANSFSTLKGEYRITAVGEVPPAAVEQIALSMQR